jgi:hypothetical protein
MTGPAARRRRHSGAVIALALISGLAYAADSKTAIARERASFGARDAGAVRCSLFVKMQEKGPSGTELQFYTWAQGYFTGRLTARPDAGHAQLAADGPQREKVYKALLSYCEKNPSATFLDAVVTLWDASGG